MYLTVKQKFRSTLKDMSLSVHMHFQKQTHPFENYCEITQKYYYHGELIDEKIWLVKYIENKEDLFLRNRY